MPDAFRGMIMRRPATRWQDALPTGNGRLGALVYGNISTDCIVLNHEALFFPSSRPELPDVSDILPEVRRLLLAGDYVAAAELQQRTYTERGGWRYDIAAYHPLADLLLETRIDTAFGAYERRLDFSNGVVSIDWDEGTTSYERDLFVSRADDVVVLRISGGPVGCRLTLAPHGIKQGIVFRPGTHFDLADPATPLAGLDAVGAPGFPLVFERHAHEQEATLVGRHADGTEFGAALRLVVVGGNAGPQDDCLVAIGTEEVLVLVKMFVNEPATTGLARIRAELAALPADYEVLYDRHAPLHREVFGRATIQLGRGDNAELANEDAMLAAYGGDVGIPLVQRMTDFGRFLLVCSSAAEGLPANLQGVWNAEYDPPWSSDFHNDENIQMNYWQALPGNMPELMLSLFDYYEQCLDAYRENARKAYGCRGILAPIAQTTDGRLQPSWAAWTAGAGWLAQFYYDYYLFTGDRQFLRDRAVPFLEEVARFYEDFLFEGKDGRLVFAPSISPENRPADIGTLTLVNATMDVAIAREVLANLCTACALLEIKAADVARWKNMRDRLPLYESNEDGALREWLWPGLEDNYHHRHQSHIYPLFPGLEVTAEEEPDLFECCRQAVEKRLVIGVHEQTGWSLAHMACIFARLGDGNRALECLEYLLRFCSGDNLLAYHNDWRSQGVTLFNHWGHLVHQMDANFGFTAAVQEMLLFSRPGLIKLLPAVPSAWKSGSVQNMLCRGGTEADFNWNAATGSIVVSLRPRRTQTVRMLLPGPIASCAGEPDAAVRLVDPENGRLALNLTPGVPVSLALKVRNGGSRK